MRDMEVFIRPVSSGQFNYFEVEMDCDTTRVSVVVFDPKNRADPDEVLDAFEEVLVAIHVDRCRTCSLGEPKETKWVH